VSFWRPCALHIFFAFPRVCRGGPRPGGGSGGTRAIGGGSQTLPECQGLGGGGGGTAGMRVAGLGPSFTGITTAAEPPPPPNSTSI